MNVMEIVQSILTYFCTAGFVSAVAYFFHLSKTKTRLKLLKKLIVLATSSPALIRN